MRLADLKALAARNNSDLYVSRFVPPGSAIIVNPEALPELGIELPERFGRRRICVHPDDVDDGPPNDA